MQRFIIKAGDTSPRLLVALTDALDQPVNLVGATVRFIMRSAAGGVALIDAPATIVNDQGGIVAYEWQTGDTDVPDDYDGSFDVTYADTTTQTFPGEGYLPITFEPALDSVTTPVTLPDLPDLCWPIDNGCCQEFDNFSPAIQERAAALAVSTLRSLTGGSVGGCDITVRPCKKTCVPDYARFYSDGTWMPYSYAGTWVNYGCGCTYDGCGCTALEQISLPTPVGPVTSVKVDGVALATTDYRVDNRKWLVRLDGGTWPSCQDLAKADTEVGTFSVTYLNAIPVDGLGAYAAGLLACEFAKSCSGEACRLPSGVTDIVRQGVAYTVAATSFSDGLTGIREVDAYITSVNPSKLRMPVRVWSPDLTSPRVTT